MREDGDSFSIANVLIKSRLIQAQSLEILISQLRIDVENKSNYMRLADVFEDIGNLYINISEEISATFTCQGAIRSTSTRDDDEEYLLSCMPPPALDTRSVNS